MRRRKTRLTLPDAAAAATSAGQIAAVAAFAASESTSVTATAAAATASVAAFMTREEKRKARFSWEGRQKGKGRTSVC